LIEPAITSACAEIGRKDLRLRVVLDEEANRHAAVRPTVPDLVKPLPSRQWLAAVEPLDQYERREIGAVHVPSTPCFHGRNVGPQTAWSRNSLNKR
jgi:hypothetical protein